MNQDLLECEGGGEPVSKPALNLSSRLSLTGCEQCKRLREELDYHQAKIEKCLYILHDLDNPHGSGRRDPTEFREAVKNLFQS